MAAEKNERGGYIYLPAGFPFSSGAAAMRGYEVVHAVFRRPVPRRDGFAAMEKRFKAEARPKQALCGVELRCPAPMTPDGFHEFNIGYRAILEDWDIIIDGVNPVGRTMVSLRLSCTERNLDVWLQLYGGECRRAADLPQCRGWRDTDNGIIAEGDMLLKTGCGEESRPRHGDHDGASVGPRDGMERRDGC